MFGYIDSNGNGSPQRTERLTSISLYYVVPTNTVPDVISATEAKVSEALTWIPNNATRFQIVQALHDYLVRNCVYDSSAVNEVISPSRTAYGALGCDLRPHGRAREGVNPLAPCRPINRACPAIPPLHYTSRVEKTQAILTQIALIPARSTFVPRLIQRFPPFIHNPLCGKF